MIKKNISFIILFFLFALVTVGLMAQSTATGRTRTSSYDVTITSNIKGAAVYIDNSMKGTAPYTEKLSKGDYSIKVTAKGYKDFVQNVSVSGATTVNAVLEPATVSVNISANVTAGIILNKKPSGRTPNTLELEPGRYQLHLEAKDYKDLDVTLNVSEKSYQAFSYKLDPATVPVSVTVTNVGGATVMVDGKAVSAGTRGNRTIADIELLPGSYSVQVTAPDYLSLSQSITVTTSSKGNAFTFELTPAMATLSFDVPPVILNRDIKDAMSEVKVYVDDKLMNPKGSVGSIEVTPGKHVIKLLSGGLSISKEINFKAASSVTLELSMSLGEK
jgi:hypothetical protein